MRTALRLGTGRLQLDLPASAAVLIGPGAPSLPDPAAAVRTALRAPISAPSLRVVAAQRQPRSVVITISDATRPVPNELLVGAILDELALAGIRDQACTILVATGMHRPSTAAEKERMLGRALLRRCQVVDHEADQPATMVQVQDDPPVRVNRRYAEADLKIVTGLIEPHFMAGFSGGSKGICPGLVDLETVQRFHGYAVMADPAATEGRLDDNPCQQIATRIAGLVGCDFLVNAAITHDRRLASVFAGDLHAAHRKGCECVATWTTAVIDGPFDLVVTSAGGHPLDQSFYQTVKGMVTALPALHAGSTLLIASACTEVGSPEFTALMQRHAADWRGFLQAIERSGRTARDQWELQLMTRVLQRIGTERLLLANDGLPLAVQRGLAVTPVPGQDDARSRAQAFVDRFAAAHPGARIAAIPEGPYTMLRCRQDAVW